MIQQLFRFFVVFLAVVEPISLLPVFVGLTETASTAERDRVARRAVMIAALILTLFAVAGGPLLRVLGISLDSFRIFGGALLFLIALDMAFAREEKTTPAENAETRRRADISVFPLAFPLISGPGSIATVLLTFGAARPDPLVYAGLIIVIAAVVALSLLVMLAAPLVMRVLGVTGANVVSRLAGVVLAALAVQFVIDGLKGAFRLG